MLETIRDRFESIGDFIGTMFWILVWFGVVLIGAGISLLEMARWLGITGASWKYLLG